MWLGTNGERCRRSVHKVTVVNMYDSTFTRGLCGDRKMFWICWTPPADMSFGRTNDCMKLSHLKTEPPSRNVEPETVGNPPRSLEMSHKANLSP